MTDSVITDQDDLGEHQEYMIAGIVILLFGLLYWFLNHGWNSNSDLDFVAGSHAPDAQLESRLGQLNSENAAFKAGTAVIATTGAATLAATAEKPDAPQANTTVAQNTAQASAEPLPLSTKEIAELKAAEIALTQSNAIREQAAEESKDQAEAISQLHKGKDKGKKGEETSGAANTEAESEARGKEQPDDDKTARADNHADNHADNSTNTTNNKDIKAKPQTQSYTLPDGTKVDIASEGFEGNLKTAITKHELFKPITFDNIYFESGSTKIKAESDHQLKATAALLHHHKDTHILLRGHTDSTGGISRNVQLSLYRANAMALALGKLGIDTKRIRIIGVGAAEPVASNETKEGRNKNRRIEVLITK